MDYDILLNIDTMFWCQSVGVFILILVRFGMLSGHLLGKELFTRLTICSFCILTICYIIYSPF